MTESITIAIDGPAAAGKSTVGRRVADAIGALFFDTGCLYRALTDQALTAGVGLSDGPALAELASRWEVQVISEPASATGYKVILGGLDVTARLRRAEVDANVSQVSAHPEVRAELLARQREVASGGSVVLIGRDIGTVVVPDASYKIFLVADREERARRRFREMLRRGASVRYRDVLADVERRDAADEGRATAPLAAAPDAIRVDSSGLTLDEVVAVIVAATVGAPASGGHTIPGPS